MQVHPLRHHAYLNAPKAIDKYCYGYITFSYMLNAWSGWSKWQSACPLLACPRQHQEKYIETTSRFYFRRIPRPKHTRLLLKDSN